MAPRRDVVCVTVPLTSRRALVLITAGRASFRFKSLKRSGSLQLFLPGAAGSGQIFLLSSSGLLIVVGVVRDTFMNIEAELKLHGYQEKLLIS